MYDPIAAARSIVEGLRATTAASEAQRKVSAEAVALMREAGISRLQSPRRYGGYELPPRAQILTCAITALGCPAASWLQMVCGAHTFIVGRFSQRCQDEVFGGNPDVLIPGTPAAQGTCVRSEGGWLLNGRWQFCSGVDHGQWILVGARGQKDEAGVQCPDMQLVMPIGDMIVDDTWHVLGMRGTGSKDIVAQNVFVPEHRGVPTREAFLGTVPGVEAPLYRLPIGVVLGCMLLGSVVGISERGLAQFIAETKVRQDIYIGGPKALRVGMQMRIAESSAEIELARDLAEKNCALLDAAMEDPKPMPTKARARLRWNVGYAVELCRRAADRLYAAAGAHATHNSSELQRYFRDVNTTSHHAIADFDSLAEVQGRLLLGLDPGGPLV